MSKGNSPKFNYDDCFDKNKYYWPTIKAIDKFLISPPEVVVPNVIIPTINRYVYIATANINLVNGVTIPANLFTDDQGNPVTEFKIFNPNGYVNLYINALMQEGGIYAVSPNSLTFSPTIGTIFARTPIVIESLGFTTISG